jgi:hypothetical protein
MSKKINVRDITLDDYKFINQWWIDNGDPIVPLKYLPNNGLGGVIAEVGKDKKLIAAAYLYQTDSAAAILNWGISDPNYKGRDRWEIGLAIINELGRRAKALGFDILQTWTFQKGLLKRYKDLGWTVADGQWTILTKVIN